MDKKFYRECPNDNCENVIGYTRKGDMVVGDKKNTLCNDCRYYEINERDEIIIDYLNNSELTHKEISNKLKISLNIITHVRKKYNLDRKYKLSSEGSKIKRDNFKSNILNKNLNIFGGMKSKESYEKSFKTRYGYDYQTFLKIQPEFKKYYNKVRNITNKNLKKYNHLFDNLDNLGRCGEKGKYQVDHNFSIKEGFNQKVLPSLISHPSNLRVIKWEDNLSKSSDCDITIEDLVFNTAEFLTKNNKIYI